MANGGASCDARAYVEQAWHSYFDPLAENDPDTPPLPEATVDLAPFINDVIPGQRGKPWTSRTRNLVEHFHKIEPEFRGSPRIAHLTACVIVCLRRNADQSDALMLFRRLLTETGQDIARILDSRWLVSVCDTVLDTAERDVDRAAAFTGAMFINALKIAETELRLYRPSRPWPPQTRMRHGGEIYDGVQSFWNVGRGDVENMFRRIGLGLKIDSPVTPIVEQLIHRAFEGNTCLQRILSLTGQPQLPIAPKQKLERLAKIMQKL